MIGDIYSYSFEGIVHVYMGTCHACTGGEDRDYMVRVAAEDRYAPHQVILPAGIVFPVECAVILLYTPWPKGARLTRKVIGKIHRKYIPLFKSFAEMTRRWG